MSSVDCCMWLVACSPLSVAKSPVACSIALPAVRCVLQVYNVACARDTAGDSSPRPAGSPRPVQACEYPSSTPRVPLEYPSSTPRVPLEDALSAWTKRPRTSSSATNVRPIVPLGIHGCAKCTCMYVCMYVCMHACMHACMYVFMYR